MLKLKDRSQAKLVKLLENKQPVWVVYLDIYKFHEVEFRHGIKACRRILEILEQEITSVLKQHASYFQKHYWESRGGDDFAIYLVPSNNTPWNIDDLAFSLVRPLQERVNRRAGINEEISLRYGIVRCTNESRRSADYMLYAAIKEAFLLNKSEPDPNYFTRRQEIERLMENPKRYLKSAFQPIVQINNSQIFGFEALARLTESTAFPNIGELFPFAEKIGQLYPIETLCRRKAILAAPGVLTDREALFLNIDPQVLSDPDFSSGQTRKLLLEQGLRPSDVVLEITERSAIKDFARFRQALDHYRSQGYRIALDDVGAGYSSLQSIAELHPDFLKIDRSLVGGVNSDPIKWALLETFVSFSKRIGCRTLAEGIETAEELKTVVQLGVDYVQGFFLARPDFNRAEISEHSLKIIQESNRLNRHDDSAILSLLEPLPLFTSDTMVSTIENYFRERPNEWLIGVVEAGKISGTLQRDQLFAALGTRYGVSLYSERTISVLVERNPLIVEDTTPIEVVSSLAMERPQAQLYAGIVVVNQQRPIGMVSISSLTKAMAERQIQIARGANPLTGLPGNLLIDRELRHRLDSTLPFGIIYADLNKFKHYNDTFGFEPGDSVIRLLAEILHKEALNNDVHAFVGHIGGDDFITLMSPEKLAVCCQAIISRFESERHKLTGAEDLSVALAGITIQNCQAETAAGIAEKAARIKSKVKQKGGNTFLVTSL